MANKWMDCFVGETNYSFDSLERIDLFRVASFAPLTFSVSLAHPLATFPLDFTQKFNFRQQTNESVESKRSNSADAVRLRTGIIGITKDFRFEHIQFPGN